MFAGAVLLAVMCSLPAFGEYWDEGRSGNSWEDAYVIRTASDLVSMKNRSSTDEGKYFVLASDIDLTSETGWSGLYFRGHFDGQNHTIRINSQTNSVYAGLFERVRSGNDSIAIRNLNVTGSVHGNCAGTIVHYLESGIVENCSFTGDMTSGSGNNRYGAGGIVAHLEGGTVRNCRVSGNISNSGYAGGIIGKVSSGNIQNCTVEENTTITGRQVGGIAGSILSGFRGNISGNKWPSRYPETGNDYTPSNDEPDPTPNNNTPIAGPTIEWNGHRYQLYTGSFTWEDAKSRCETLGGHLATITSRPEQNVVSSLLSGAAGTYWLGASMNESGWWKWETDEVFERQFANFASGQPDGAGNRLAILSTGGWDDVHSSENASGFICEWDDDPEQVEAAPLAPLFQNWLEHPEEWADSEVIPSPIDLSHLANNPPRVSASGSGVRVSAPDPYYDGRTAINLPPARDQGDGTKTCWAFAAVGAMEASYLAQGLRSLGTVPDLSELQIVWEVKKSSGRDPVTSDMGNPKDVCNANSDTVPVNETEFPYYLRSSNAAIEAYLRGRTPAKAPITLTDSPPIGQITPETADQVKQNVKDYGGVAFLYYSDQSEYSGNSYYVDGGTKTNHCALIVGWNDNYPASNFKNTPPEPGAWLVRNSWGAGFGDNGYFWMSYSQHSAGVGLQEARAFIVSEDRTQGRNTHQNNKHGETENITPNWSAGIFRSNRDENLVQIAFPTTDNNTDYQLFVNKFGQNRPTDPGDAENPILSGSFPNAGTHTITLPSPVTLCSGDYYAVIVKLTLNSDYEYPTGVEASIAGYVTASVSAGNSFFATGDPVPDVWQDGAYIEGGPYNACIQAITVPRASSETAPKITTLSLPAAAAGQDYSGVTLQASGTVLEWRCGNIPQGMVLSRQGVLSGRPVSGGEYDLKITAFNNAGSDTVTLRLTVSGGSQGVNTYSSGEHDDWICSSGFGSISLVLAAVFFMRRKGRQA